MPIIPEQPGINALAPQQQQPTAPPQGMPPGAGMQQPRDFGLAGAPMPPPEPELPVPIEEDDRDELDVDADDRDVKWLRGLVSPITCRNVAEFLTDDELSKIGNDVKRFFEIDKESRSEWERLMELAMKLAKQVIEVKNTPWPNSSSVKFPLLTVAAIQFAARAYPEIVKGWDLVKTKIVGPDPMRQKFMRGERISKHMSYQLNEEMPEWDEEFDKLLHILPIMGLVLKKTYYDPVLQRNCSDLALIDDVVIHYKAKSIDRVRRITHVLPFYENDIYENVQKKIWLDEEFGLAQNDDYPNDEEAPHLFLEQHCFLDLDGDGYKEPYVVTVHKEHGKVVRIVPRFDEKGIKTKEDEDGEEVVVSIKPIQYFTKFGFIPNPDGSFYDLGFGWLLGAIGESINSIINQLIDAGTRNNLGGGFIAGIRLKTQSQVISTKPGEWMPVQTSSPDLRAGMIPFPTVPPSPVLFQLLNLLIQAAKDITSVKDIMTGNEPATNTPATTSMAMIEQAQKIFGGIHKRVYRSCKAEFGKLYYLNGVYLDEFVQFNYFGVPMAVAKNDYRDDGLDVIPVADPNMTSDVLRMARAQALMQLGPRPGIKQNEVTRRILEALKEEDMEQLFDPNAPPQPNPKLMEVQGKLQIEQQKLKIAAQEAMTDLELAKAQVKEIMAKTMLALAKAQTEQSKPQLAELELYAKEMEMRLGSHTSLMKEIIKGAIGEQARSGDSGKPGAVQQVEAGPGNAGGGPAPQGTP